MLRRLKISKTRNGGIALNKLHTELACGEKNKLVTIEEIAPRHTRERGFESRNGVQAYRRGRQELRWVVSNVAGFKKKKMSVKDFRKKI